MTWLKYTLVTTIFYGTFNIFMKLASSYGINNKLGTFILNLTATLIMVMYFILLKPFSRTTGNLLTIGIVFAVLAGVSAAIGNTSRFIAYDLKAPLATSQLISSIGSMAITSIASFIIFKESFTLGKFIGLIIGSFGIYLMVTR